jgi:gamma-glutamylcyclotransferase (GGCT)/AIG2-like uncharacterized protein YtfP
MTDIESVVDAVNIFVYGTLRPPQEATPADDSRYYPAVVDYLIEHCPATLPGAVLFDMGAFPGALPGEGVLHGDLLRTKPEALSVLDRIEGHPTFFRREQATVETDHGPVEAWIYWAPAALTVGRRQISGGDWFLRGREDADGDSAQGLCAEQQDQPADPVLRKLVERFAESECSWLSTVRADGRAHSAPIWHVWYQGRIYFVTTSQAVKTANIARNPAVVLTHPDPVDPIIIEGWATLAQNMRGRLRPFFLEKYKWDLDTDAEYDMVFEVTPIKLMAWGKHGEGRWSSEALFRVW